MCPHAEKILVYLPQGHGDVDPEEMERERERVEEERGTPLLSALFTYPKINDISFILI